MKKIVCLFVTFLIASSWRTSDTCQLNVNRKTISNLAINYYTQENGSVLCEGTCVVAPNHTCQLYLNLQFKDSQNGWRNFHVFSGWANHDGKHKAITLEKNFREYQECRIELKVEALNKNREVVGTDTIYRKLDLKGR